MKKKRKQVYASSQPAMFNCPFRSSASHESPEEVALRGANVRRGNVAGYEVA